MHWNEKHEERGIERGHVLEIEYTSWPRAEASLGLVERIVDEANLSRYE
jgi:hypothetical protein